MPKSLILKKDVFLCAIIVFLQVIMVIYWGDCKQNYYWDEYFTFENAHFCSDNQGVDVYISSNPKIDYDVWENVETAKGEFQVERNASVINDSFNKIVNKIFEKKPYMVFLNIWEGLFFADSTVKWAGISLNVVFFVIQQFFLYKIARFMSDTDYFPFFTLSLYGFSGICISMIIFVRFYMWLACVTSIGVYLHMLLYECENWIKMWILEILILVNIYLGFLNSPLIMIFFMILACGYSTLIIINGKAKLLFSYIIPLFGGGIFLLTKTNYIYNIFNFRQYVENKKEKDAMWYLLNEVYVLDWQELKSRIVVAIHNIGNGYVGNVLFFVLIILLYVVANAIMWGTLKKEKQYESILKWNSYWVDYTRKHIWYLLMFIVLVGYLVSALLMNLYIHIRYISFVIPILTIILTYCISEGLLKKIGLKKQLIFCVILIVLELILVNRGEAIQFVYEDDGKIFEEINSMKIENVFVENADTHIMGEAIVHSPENAKIFFQKNDLCDMEELPLQFLMWTQDENTELQRRIRENGYEISTLGKTYMFYIKLVWKQ